jgi:hypothetical protein
MSLTYQIDVPLQSFTEAKAEQYYAALRTKLDSLNEQLQSKVMDNLSGAVVHAVSGKAARSVEMIPSSTSGTLTEGAVQAGGRLAPYLKYQELGTVGPYTIAPKFATLPGEKFANYHGRMGKPVGQQAGVLAFVWKGRKVFFKSVMHPGLDAKEPVKKAAIEMAPVIVAGIKEVGAEVFAS